MAFLFMDLDKFKAVNDRYGHAAGDALIREVGRTLLAGVRNQDVLGRMGGDEFTLCLYKVKSERALKQLARKLVSRVAAIALPQAPEVQAAISIGGIYLSPDQVKDQALTLESLLDRADRAMYQAKQGDGVSIAGALSV